MTGTTLSDLSQSADRFGGSVNYPQLIQVRSNALLLQDFNHSQYSLPPRFLRPIAPKEILDRST